MHDIEFINDSLKKTNFFFINLYSFVFKLSSNFFFLLSNDETQPVEVIIELDIGDDVRVIIERKMRVEIEVRMAFARNQ